jgi:hypothetical protein
MFAFYLVAAPSASAQGPPPPPPPPPAKDYFPDKWDEYASAAGKFRIRFPKEPRESVNMQGQLEVHSLEHKGLLHYRVSYVDYKTQIDDPQKIANLLQGLKNAALNSLQGKNIRVVAEREVTVDGYKGIFIHIEIEGREVVRLQWVIAGSRLYSISTSSRMGSPNEMEGKDDFEKVATGFISSFHVTP